MPDSPIRLGLLDFSWVGAGQSPADTLSDTFALAEVAEVLGFTRYWLGEHHIDGHACGSPQVLAALVAASTRRIRVGVGAMLMYYWAPLKLAEDFCLLESIFRRIDLGVGRGRADDSKSHLALLDGRAGNDGLFDEQEYGAKLDDLVAHLRGTLPEAHPHRGAPVIPALDVMPEVWICGSSTAAPQAARTGTRFCCTLFHGGIAPPVHMQRYHDTFQPSADLPAPHGAIAVAGVCADTEAEAAAMCRAFPNRHYVPTVTGTPEQCRTRIDTLRDAYGVDDVLLLDIAPDRDRRIRSAELLAAALELRP